MNSCSLYVKYLGVFINENLNWKIHINEISIKLIKGNAMLTKLMHFVNKDCSQCIMVFFTHI